MPRISILEKDGRLAARLGDFGGENEPSPFIAPHGIAVDSTGAIYVAELSYAVAGKKAGGKTHQQLTTLQKLVPVREAVPFATLDGIKTHYVRQGSGPPLLMMAPRAFDSTLQSWKHGKWDDVNAVEALSKHFTVIAYDRREAGQSGGRLELLTWKIFAQHAKLLLEHLLIERAYILGVCMGVGVATRVASLYPEAAIGLILAQPVGGHRWKNRMHAFFDRHLAYARQHGLEAVRARAKGLNFMRDPEAGPWATSIVNDAVFAERLVRQDLESYLRLVTQSRDAMFPDTFVSGPLPEELMTIDVPASIWPGDDASHSTSSAQQLRELLPRMEYWDLHPDKQTAQEMLARLVEFKNTIETRGLPAEPADPRAANAAAGAELS